MARIRLIILAVLAVFVVGAVASASASAAEAKGEFVNNEGKSFVKKDFTATSGETILTAKVGAGATEIKCKNDLALILATSVTGGEQTVHFTGCTSGSLPCKSEAPSAAGAAGEIISLSGLLILILHKAAGEDTVTNTIFNAGTKEAGVLHISCSGIKIETRGTFFSNGIATPTKSGAGLLISLSASQSAKGVQTVQEDELKVKHHLETSVEGGAFEESSEVGTEKLMLLEEGEYR